MNDWYADVRCGFDMKYVCDAPDGKTWFRPVSEEFAALLGRRLVLRA